MTVEIEPLINHLTDGEEEEKRDDSLPALANWKGLAAFPIAQGGTVSIADLSEMREKAAGDDGDGWSLEELFEKFEEWDEYYSKPLSVDPFANRTPGVSLYQIFKFIILLPIALIRLIIFFFALFLCWVVSAIAIRGLTFPRRASEVPALSMERRRWAEKIAGFNRVMMWACGFFKFTRTGERDKSAGTLVANHVSFFDPFIINSDMAVAPLNKKEFVKIPMAGTILRAIQAILVDRTSKESRKETAIIMKKRAQDNQAEPDTWPPTLVFPEGTCTNGDAVMGFRPGAFLAGEAVQPVVLRYPWSHFDNSFTPSIDLPRIVLFSIFQFRNKIEMKYLPLYHPSPEEKNDPALYAKNIQELIAKEMGVPATKHSYYDMRLIETAYCKRGFPVGSIRIEFDLLKEKLPKLTSSFVDKCFEDFCEIDTKHTGKISYSQLIGFYHLPSSSAPLHQLFNKIGILSEDEEFEFVEFVILTYGLLHLASPESDLQLFKQLDISEEKQFVGLMGHHEEWAESEASALFQHMSQKEDSLSFDNFKQFLDLNLFYRFLFLSYAKKIEGK